jgi:hypothetical protein
VKSYNYLFEQFINEDNIRISIHDAAIGKKRRDLVAKVLNDVDRYIPIIKDYAINFHNAYHKPIEIYDGVQRKKRVIIVPTFFECVIHHMIVNVLKPIFMKGMYYHTYASIENKGNHKGKRFIEKWLTEDPKNTQYCLKIDIRKFFNSIPHGILLQRLHNLIHDQRFMSVLEEVINAVPNGLPLGFYTSQWLANWYLQPLDHYIKEQLHIKYSIRYMDDMVMFAMTSSELHYARNKISNYLNNELGLELKDNWQVFLMHNIDIYGNEYGRFLDFMGFRFYRNRTTLRKSIMIKSSRKARHIAKKDHPTMYDARQMLAYKGWYDHTDTAQLYKDRIAPYVDMNDLQRKVSKYDKAKAKKKKKF